MQPPREQEVLEYPHHSGQALSISHLEVVLALRAGPSNIEQMELDVTPTFTLTRVALPQVLLVRMIEMPM